MELYEQLERTAGVQAQAIAKHLKASGVNEWADLTKARLMDFRDTLKRELAPSSAKTVAAALSAFLHRYEEEGLIPCTTFSEILRLRNILGAFDEFTEDKMLVPMMPSAS